MDIPIYYRYSLHLFVFYYLVSSNGNVIQKWKSMRLCLEPTMMTWRSHHWKGYTVLVLKQTIYGCNCGLSCGYGWQESIFAIISIFVDVHLTSIAARVPHFLDELYIVISLQLRGQCLYILTRQHLWLFCHVFNIGMWIFADGREDGFNSIRLFRMLFGWSMQQSIRVMIDEYWFLILNG